MEEFSSTGQLVTIGLVDSSIEAMAKGLTLVDVEASIAKDLLHSNLIGHFSFFTIIAKLFAFHAPISHTGDTANKILRVN